MFTITKDEANRLALECAREHGYNGVEFHRFAKKNIPDFPGIPVYIYNPIKDETSEEIELVGLPERIFVTELGFAYAERTLFT